ncbi:MAG: hypothetical protein RR206_09005, partial [Bacteroidaceae bacterium]
DTPLDCFGQALAMTEHKKKSIQTNSMTPNDMRTPSFTSLRAKAKQSRTQHDDTRKSIAKSVLHPFKDEARNKHYVSI